MSLKSRLLLRFSVGLVITATILFVPAGSLRFWQAWMVMVLVFTPLISSSLYFCKHDPQLMERRLQSKEKAREQKLFVRLFAPLFFVAFLMPGLDYRWGWSRTYLHAVPLWLMLLSQVLVLAGLLFVVWVLKVNSFASRIIQVEPGQRVISSGPYGMVRHPMYLGSVVMFLSLPLALGSYLALPIFALNVPFYVFRLLNEERLLRKELPGYPDYCLRTPFRLIPFVW